jgi:3-deoxy-manno-octulosonate cytidylyltransferase (CMP-KDO synthetase)
VHKVVGLIPTRLNSRRLPKKSIRIIGNLPLIIHTYRRASLSTKLDDLYICCDSIEVLKLAKKYNAKAILTSKKHKCGTDRVCEALKKLKKKFNQIIDIQGDEPLIDPKNIDKVIDFHRKNFKYDIILPNLITSNKFDQNIVKLIFNKYKEVLYLTRSSSPHPFKKKIKKIFKHLSIVSFSKKALTKFSKSNQTKLEKIEDVELLRALDIGLKIKTFSLKGDSFSVDTKKNLIDARKKIKKDKYYKSYYNNS